VYGSQVVYRWREPIISRVLGRNRWPAVLRVYYLDKVAIEEEEDVVCTLAVVDVADHVCITIAYESGPSFLEPGIVKPILLRPRHVLEDAPDGDDMIFMWPLHEPAKVPNREGKIRPGVQQVSE
jgi:hypothetical protein